MALELVEPLICVMAGALMCRHYPVELLVDNMGSFKIWQKVYRLGSDLCSTLATAISNLAAGSGCRLAIEKIARCSSPGGDHG